MNFNNRRHQAQIETLLDNDQIDIDARIGKMDEAISKFQTDFFDSVAKTIKKTFDPAYDPSA